MDKKEFTFKIRYISAQDKEDNIIISITMCYMKSARKRVKKSFFEMVASPGDEILTIQLIDQKIV